MRTEPSDLATRRVSRAALTPDVVLDAALTLFARRGYHGTALSEIAEALAVRTPSLYNHMGSKHDLLRTIVDRTTAAVLDDFHAVLDPDDPPATQLRRAARVYAYRHATHRREALVVNRDTGSLEEPAFGEMQARRREHEHALRAVITRGVETGDFAVESPALASFAIREMCVSVARWFSPDGALTAEQVADQYSGFALRLAGSSP
ncbi:TetR family transcriptional regulator [Actinomycetospora sp. NBRC 106375]|uniref:TetR/AcrR family transcriptional regulator n=1 Tax=Actinomycetospora sp. NBRC 106375 TaxID=3032207 RepID=UPI0024A5B84C|nr:TetR/AcrR family transcriptional regulator [Actinomycetospora sp. NBRC 106375]GLZ47819.1 TetR family transcriptional regulator [Actinomycetospora sp. NBRC 106375]